LSSVYLVRHGQAGTRDAYDSLSELGRRQARRLGKYFMADGVHFTTAQTGEMLRQQETAAEVKAAYQEAEVAFPEVKVEPGWSEFDLNQVYSGLAPQLCAEDPDFQREYEAMREETQRNRGIHEAGVHRRWLSCDTKVVAAWVSGRYEYGGESWRAFHQRVENSLASMNGGQKDANVVVFTSAMPIAICLGLVLGTDADRVLQLAGALQNASYTMLRGRNEHFRLYRFNTVPYLTTQELRTHR